MQFEAAVLESCIVDALTKTTLARDERIRETVKQVEALGAFQTLAARTQLVAIVQRLSVDPDEITGGINTPTFLHALQMLETLAQEGSVCVKAADVERFMCCLKCQRALE